MNLKALVECIHELQQDSEAQSTFRSVFSTRLTPTLLRGLGLRASPRRRGGCPELEFDTQMPKGLLGEGKAQALLAKAGGEETVYARPKLPKLDRAPAGVQSFTRSQALAALGGGDKFKSVGGGRYIKVTRAILADVDTPPPRPEQSEEERKRARKRSRYTMDIQDAGERGRSADKAKKRRMEEVYLKHQQSTKKRKAEATARKEREDERARAKTFGRRSKLGALKRITQKAKEKKAGLPARKKK